MADRSAQLLAALEIAKITAALSYCERAKVGAVLTRDGRVVSMGYNGTVSGRPNVCEVENDEWTHAGHPQGWPCNEDCGHELVTKDEVVHAEMNVIAFAAKTGESTKGTTMVTTLSPCFNCAKLIAQAGVVAVFFGEAYDDQRGVAFLNECGVACERIEA